MQQFHAITPSPSPALSGPPSFRLLHCAHPRHGVGHVESVRPSHRRRNHPILRSLEGSEGGLSEEEWGCLAAVVLERKRQHEYFITGNDPAGFPVRSILYDFSREKQVSFTFFLRGRGRSPQGWHQACLRLAEKPNDPKEVGVFHSHTSQSDPCFAMGNSVEKFNFAHCLATTTTDLPQATSSIAATTSIAAKSLS